MSDACGAAASAAASPSLGAQPASQASTDVSMWGRLALEAYREMLPNPEMNDQAYKVPAKVGRDERTQLIRDKLRSLPGWEEQRAFVLMSNQTVQAISEIIVDRMALWENVELERDDVNKISDDIGTHVDSYFEQERVNDPMSAEQAEALQKEHQERRVKENSYYLVDVLNADDTITLAEREHCMLETLQKMRDHFRKERDSLLRTVQNTLQPLTPAQQKRATQVEARKQEIRKEWATRITNAAEMDLHRAFRSYLHFHLLQTQSRELFAYAKDAYDRGALLTDKKGVQLLNPDTGDPLRSAPQQRCFLTITMPAECEINFLHTWGWRDSVTTTTLPDFIESANFMSVQEIRGNQTCFDSLLEYTEEYDPEKAFVLCVRTRCMPIRKPPELNDSELWCHQWLLTQYAYKLEKDVCIDPVPLPTTMRTTQQAIEQMPDVSSCCECNKFFFDKGVPMRADASFMKSRIYCRSCKDVCAAEGRKHCTGLAVFCNEHCAVTHTAREHPDQMTRSFVKQAEEQEKRRLKAVRVHTQKMRDHMHEVASTIEDAKEREEFIKFTSADIDAEEARAKRTRSQVEEDKKQASMQFMRQQAEAAQKRAEMAREAEATDRASAPPTDTAKDQAAVAADEVADSVACLHIK